LSPLTYDVKSPYRRIRRRLRRYRRLHGAYYFLVACQAALFDSPARARAELERWYARAPDPWHYASSLEERERYATALEMIDGSGPERVASAVEIGCGEGLFTERLAERCDSVLGLDVSRTALERARRRCGHLDHVRFATWDARVDPLPGEYDLVVCMDVMDDLHRPTVQRRAMGAVDGAVAPGGRLLVSAVVQSPVFEESRWAAWLGRGGRNILAAFAARDRRLLERVRRNTENHVLALFEARYLAGGERLAQPRER
jgi:2-polyprenyl-3-methyl-5-hydroxy-6-metoxy-1,4-benzoquinol methylase